MKSTGSFSKPFFTAGLSIALALAVLGSLRPSYQLDLPNLIFFPASVLLPFAEKSTSAARIVTAVFQVMLNGVIYGLIGVLLDKVIPIVTASKGRRIPLAPISDLPIWRRLIIISSLGLYAIALPMSIGTELAIYKEAPDHRDEAKGRTNLVHVNHGFTRYVTIEEKQHFEFWQDLLFRYAGPFFVATFFIWITAPLPPSSRSIDVR